MKSRSLAFRAAGYAVALALCPWAGPADAAVPSPAPMFCARAHFASFRARDLPTVEPAADDLCADESSLSAPLRELLGRAGELNDRVARALGTPPETLFGPGLSLEYAGASASALPDAEGTPGVIKLSGHEVSLHAAEYVHALAHALDVSDGHFLPAALSELGQTRMFRETLAGVLSYELVGPVDESSMLIPQCASRISVVRQLPDFSSPQGYFASNYRARSLAACCDYLSRRDLHDFRSRAICDQLSTASPAPDEDLSSNGAPFDPEDYLLNPQDYDVHRLAASMTAFLNELGGELGRSPLELFLDGFRAAARASAAGGHGAGQARFRCSIAAFGTTPGGLEPIETEAPSLEAVFSALRVAQDRAGQAAFDDLWRRQDMAKAAVLMRADARELAEKLHAESLRSNLFLIQSAWAIPVPEGADREPKCEPES